MQLYAKENESSLKTILKQLLNDISSSTNPDINALQLKISENSNEPSLTLLDANGLVLDYLKLPITSESFAKRLQFWVALYSKTELINSSSLLYLSHNFGTEKARKIFDSFVLSAVKKFAIIKKSLTESDYQHLFEAAHYLKTSAGIVGADSLFLFCEISLEKTKLKEPWTPSFFNKFIDLELTFQHSINKYRP